MAEEIFLRNIDGLQKMGMSMIGVLAIGNG